MTHSLTKKTIKLTLVAALAGTLAACGGSSTPDSGANTDTTGTATYDSASTFPHGSCMLWKPISEIDHGLVVLIPAGMGSHKPQILTSNGEVYASGREHVDARGHNKCNGMRYHWIFSKGKGHDYPKKVVLKVGSNHYQIPDGGRRYE